MMLYSKYESSGLRQEDFWKFHFKNLFIDPVTYLCNQLEQFEGVHQGIIPVKFGQNPMSGFRGEDG